MTAGRRGNTDDVESLLASRRFIPRIVAWTAGDAAADAAQQRWEVDGGHLYASP
jgi:hypothetical protein